MAKKATTKFPKTIMVRRITDSGDPFLTVDEDGTEAEDGETVAIYELREIKTKRVTHGLE